MSENREPIPWPIQFESLQLSPTDLAFWEHLRQDEEEARQMLIRDACIPAHLFRGDRSERLPVDLPVPGVGHERGPGDS